MNNSEDNKYDEFVRLYSHHEPHIRAYLRSLLPSWQDVDEVTQEVSVVIWKKFDHFDTSTDFMRWVCVIARFEVLRHRRKHARTPVVFSDELFAIMAEEGDQEIEKRQEEFKALKKCLSTLPKAQRSFIILVYDEKRKIVDIAEQMNSDVKNLYMQLSRIRKALFKCIRARLLEAK